MSIEAGRTLLHYRIVGKIGEGGMGVVWKALDTSLDRDVAIKILPDVFSGEPDREARFEREAKLLASLDHPNIASIYGLHHDDAVRFIAMELLDGEDLAAKLARGPLAFDDALDIAIEIARALEAAHASGIIHRDLKPANVLRTADGRIKVLDFGLAKALEGDPASRSGSASLSPTMTSAGTVAGTLIGTASYMSPEQARGRTVDRRADIWAFGAVLFEMLAGRKAFDGETVAEALASVLKTEPDWSALPPGTPSGVRRVLRRCLAKNPAARIHDVADVRIELEESRHGDDEATAAPGTLTGSAPGFVARLLPWVIAIPALIVAAWFATAPREAPTSPPSRVVSSLLPPENARFDLRFGLALSPDGTRVAFGASDEDGVDRLWVRVLDRDAAQALAGTEGGHSPFWSPDGRHLGFFGERGLSKLELSSGLVETIAPTVADYGATWGSAGDIVFVQRQGRPLMRVPAGGGDPQPVTEVEQVGVDYHMWPSFLPDGKHFLFYVRRYGSVEQMGELRIGSIDGGPSTVLFPSNSAAQFAAPGHILWWQQGNLRAQGFDPDTRTLVGESTGLLADVRFDPRRASPAFSVSATGVLVYQRAGEPGGDRLVWLDRQGHETGTLGPVGSLYSPRLSPDGTRVAVDISDESNRGDVWILDVRRGSATRMTTAEEDESCPVWSPDGSALAYCSVAGSPRFRPIIMPAGGPGAGKVLTEAPGRDLDPIDWHGDQILVEGDAIDGGSQDLYRVSTTDGELHPFVATAFEELQATFSPDGRHVAYASDESGVLEVYIRDYPGGGRRWQVSVDGGRMPRWNPDGAEILFLAADGHLTAVPFTRHEVGDEFEFEFGAAERLFAVDVKDHDSTQWDVLDGRRFLFNIEVRAGATDPLTLVQGWQLTPTP